MQLFPTPDNPIPGEPEVLSVTTRDRMTLRVAAWLPSCPEPKGTVCLLQGRAEFIEKYFETIGELLERGFAVVAFDWRGQGHSGRRVGNPRKGHVGSFREYRIDLEAIRDEILRKRMPRPYFALAHSMGGAVAIRAVHDGWSPFRRIVTTTPMIQIAVVRRLRLAVLAARMLRLLGFGKSFIPGGGETSIATKRFADNPLTSDPRRYSRNAAAASAVGNGAIGDPTIGWLDSAFRFMKGFMNPRFGLKVRSPVLIIAAGSDLICATPAAERFAARLKAGFAIVIPGARHEILMERDRIREQFWAAFDAFVPGTPDSVPEGAEHRVPAPKARAAALMSSRLSTAREAVEVARQEAPASPVPEHADPDISDAVAPRAESVASLRRDDDAGIGDIAERDEPHGSRAEPALPRVMDSFSLLAATPSASMTPAAAPADAGHQAVKATLVEPLSPMPEAVAHLDVVKSAVEAKRASPEVMPAEEAGLATNEGERSPENANASAGPAEESPAEDDSRRSELRLPAATMLPPLGGKPSGFEEFESGGVDALVPGGDDSTATRR